VQVTVTAKPKSTCKAILGFYGADTKNMDLPDLVRQVAASGTEQQLRLTDDASGMLTGGTMPEYLYRRTSVVAGLLERPAEDGCREAIETGTERLTRTLLDNVTLSLPRRWQPRRQGRGDSRRPVRARPARLWVPKIYATR
jgi:hypothetical protein